MKKQFFAVLMLCFMALTANAQTDVQIKKSVERAAQLQALCDDYKTSGFTNIDGYGDAVKAAAVFAIANSVQLENLYKRQIGETKDGVTDVTVKKPTLEEWMSLATTINGEGDYIKKAVDKVQSATTDCKNEIENATKVKNPLKAGKIAKKVKIAKAILEFGNKATVILAEESKAQVEAVANIIQIIKSGKNL